MNQGVEMVAYGLIYTMVTSTDKKKIQLKGRNTTSKFFQWQESTFVFQDNVVKKKKTKKLDVNSSFSSGLMNIIYSV